jgi:hypothetical protein
MTEKLDPARIIIADYIELKTLVSGEIPWNELTLIHNPPRYLRIVRIKACMRALNLKCEDFRDFETGVSIRGMKSDSFLKVEELLWTGFSIDRSEYIDEESDSFFSASNHFYMLLSSRLNIYRFHAQRDAVLAASGHFLTPVLVIDKIEEQLKSSSAVLDQALCILLNPQGLSWTLSELIDQFDFPSEDLDAIDLDWI